jgi:hypothetical protein
MAGLDSIPKKLGVEGVKRKCCEEGKKLKKHGKFGKNGNP